MEGAGNELRKFLMQLKAKKHRPPEELPQGDDEEKHKIEFMMPKVIWSIEFVKRVL